MLFVGFAPFFKSEHSTVTAPHHAREHSTVTAPHRIARARRLLYPYGMCQALYAMFEKNQSQTPEVNALVQSQLAATAGNQEFDHIWGDEEEVEF